MFLSPIGSRSLTLFLSSNSFSQVVLSAGIILRKKQFYLTSVMLCKINKNNLGYNDKFYMKNIALYKMKVSEGNYEIFPFCKLFSFE